MKHEQINFNKLAWDAPKHGDTYGYTPADEHYAEIVEWLKSGTKKWTSRLGNVTTTRVTFDESSCDAIVEYNHTNKMIFWTFRRINTYQI